MNKIPKVIHYCWFGGNPLPELVERCIESWRKYCPDYEIIRWDETLFDISAVQYVKEAYAAKKWAFVSDYVRLYALVNYGGVYLDTDVELFRPIDCFLEETAFTGFESKDSPVTAIMGCVRGHALISELFDYYTDRSFYKNGKMDLRPNTETITKILTNKGIQLNGKKQEVSGCTIYPEVVFCPNNLLRIFDCYSRKSYCVHHFMGSWGTTSVCYKRNVFQKLRMYGVHVGRNLLGTPNIQRIGRFVRRWKKKSRFYQS